MIRTVWFATILLMFFGAKAQHSSELLNYESLNIAYLEQLVKQRIDSFRVEKGIEPLRNDSLLLRAAKQHSNYMKGKNKLTHFQEKGPKHDPQKRFEYFKINHVLAGENVAFIPINTLLLVDYAEDAIKIRTYADLAEAIALNWRYSKPHYSNILTTAFEVTAISIQIDLNSNSLWATQVFGQVLGPHEYTKGTSSFPYDELLPTQKKKVLKPAPDLKTKTKYAYRLKHPDSHLDCPRELNNKIDVSNLKLQIIRDEVVLCVYDLNKIKRLFIEKKDGLVVELIDFENSVSCTGINAQKANTRNGLGRIDGELLKPVYRNEILKQIELLEEQNRKRKSARNEVRCNYLVLGNVTLERLKRPVKAKLYFVNDGNLCTEIEFFGFCGKLLDFKPSNMPLRFDLKPSNYKPLSDTLLEVISVNFEKGNTTFNHAGYDDLLKQIEKKEVMVKRIHIDANASVEGTEKENELLTQKRAVALSKTLSQYQNKSVLWTVSSKENWDLFFKQIRGTKWAYLSSWSKEKIRRTINDSSHLQELEPFFSKQRAAKLQLTLVPVMNDSWKFRMAKSEWLKIWSQQSGIMEQETVDHLLEIQSFFYNNYHNCSEEEKNFIDQQAHVDVKGKEMTLLTYRSLMWKLKKGTDIEPILVVDRLKRINRVLLSEEVDYNIKAIIAKHAEAFDEKMKLPLIRSLLNQAEQGGGDQKTIHELQMWYHIEVASLVFGSQNKKGMRKAEASLNFIREFYISDHSGVEDSIDLAEFFILFGKSEWASALLRPLAFKKQNRTALELYLRNCVEKDYEGRVEELRVITAEAFNILGEKTWCRMFYTPCSIPYYVLDYPPLYTLYCSACMDFSGKKAIVVE